MVSSKDLNISLSFVQKIGVTSVYAGGKGTVVKELARLGAVAIDFDLLARRVVEPKERAYQQVIDLLGKDIVTKDGHLDRREIGRRVFNDDSLLKSLNSIIHPEVRQLAEEMIANEVRQDPKAIFALDIPLLVEADLTQWVDLVVVVDTPYELCLKRGQKRDGLSSEEIEARIKNQLSINEKRKYADYVIKNGGSLDTLRGQIHDLWRLIQKHNGVIYDERSL